MDLKLPLSVAIIAKNEAENLPACLQSVAFASQIVLVDSGSTDQTVEVARAWGCDVFSEAWQGFGPQKQLAIDRCREAWVLVLDADERIPPETALAIGEVLRVPPPGVAAYSFPRKNFFQGRWIRHAGWWPDRIVRLFRRERGRMSRVPVHEGIEVDGPVSALASPIEHYTESSLAKVLQKIDHYSTLGAREAYGRGQRATVWEAFFRGGFTFFQDYILRLGMLDGVPGLTLAVTDGVNKFFKYAKLCELGREEKKQASCPVP